MRPESIAGALSLLLAGVFVVAGIAKLRSPQPPPAHGRFASAVILLGGLVPYVELGVAALLVVLPLAGFVASAALICVFTAYLVSLPSDVPCQCFGSGAPHDRGAGVARNLALLAVATSGIALASLERATLDLQAVQIALLTTVALVTLSAHARAVRLQRRVGRVTRI